MHFNITKQSKKDLSRRAVLSLSKIDVETPVFMPVGTNGSVKGISVEEIKAMGYGLILGNTYHLYLRPGEKLVKKMGGIQRFMNWGRGVLTDSGGYQVFSLGQNFDGQKSLVSVYKNSVHFRSHLDGSRHIFTPEKVIDIQKDLGSDIMMVLDECTEFPATHERAQESMTTTHKWAKIANDYWQETKNDNQALFGIIQGSTFKDLREESAKFISSLDFDGIAVGGVSVGEGKSHMYDVMRWVGPLLPKDKPHYLMGIGEPEDIIEAVKWGFDMFDCVLPTRLGRHGTVWTTKDWQKFPKIDLRKSKHEFDQKPIMKGCGCEACSKGYTRAYLHHLFKTGEMLGLRLASLHNLWLLAELMKKIRKDI